MATIEQETSYTLHLTVREAQLLRVALVEVSNEEAWKDEIIEVIDNILSEMDSAEIGDY